jgi:RecB family exonuclease
MSQIGISNTEVKTADSCELQWGFAFHPDMHFAKREMSVARDRGIIFHEGLEIYYKGIRDGRAPDESAQESLSHIQELRVKELKAGDFADAEKLEVLNWIHQTLTEYFKYYEDDHKYWEILEVEAFHAQEFEGEIDFYLPARLDMTIYQKSGNFKGETSPVDHKTTYDFYNSWKLDLNSQFPLYILALRAARFAGKPEPVVKRVIVNQIRTRPLKDPQPHDLFKRSFQPYSTIRLQKVFENHLKSAVRLAYLKRLPWEEALSEIKAAFGGQACQYCDFKDLCSATFDDRDPTDIITATLKKNSYGYPALEEIRRERN